MNTQSKLTALLLGAMLCLTACDKTPTDNANSTDNTPSQTNQTPSDKTTTQTNDNATQNTANDDDAKIAIVAKVIQNIDDRHNVITENASESLFAAIIHDENSTPAGEMDCAEWAMVGGQDFDPDTVRQTTKYQVRDDGAVLASFNLWEDSPSQVVFKLIQENGQYVIDDFYNPDYPDATFKQGLDCGGDFVETEVDTQ